MAETSDTRLPHASAILAAIVLREKMMQTAMLAPFEVEVQTEEEQAQYDDWLRAKVQESLDNPGPGIPNDVVMARIRAIIASAKQAA